VNFVNGKRVKEGVKTGGKWCVEGFLWRSPIRGKAEIKLIVLLRKRKGSGGKTKSEIRSVRGWGGR